MTRWALRLWRALVAGGALFFFGVAVWRLLDGDPLTSSAAYMGLSVATFAVLAVDSISTRVTRLESPQLVADPRPGAVVVHIPSGRRMVVQACEQRYGVRGAVVLLDQADTDPVWVPLGVLAPSPDHRAARS